MKLIKTVVDDTTYASLTKKRKAAGLPSVSALFLAKCNELTDEREASEIVRRATRIAAKKSSGEEFKLQELFPLTQWDRFSKGARLRAGRLFKAEVDAAKSGVRASYKSSSNHQFYIKA